MNIIINKDRSFLNQLHHAMDRPHLLSSWNLFSLYYDIRKKTLIKDFHSLIAPNYLSHVTFMEHQIDTVKTVMEEMNGRAILADEVGLGKTIEAGLILKEYMIRGMVKNVLLLVPASLVQQWVTELHEKFHIQAIPYRKNYQWSDYPIFVTSLDMAKRPDNQEKLSELEFDMVIVDEAHKLKNQKTKNYAFVSALKKKYCLLLTATPIENKLIEIFNLISILKPGYLGPYDEFKKNYKEKKNMKEDAYLQKLIQKVMVRNLRKDTILDEVKRQVETIWIDFSDEEYEVYQALENWDTGFSSLSRLTYLKELCSSREACYLSLENTKNEQLLEVKEEMTGKIAMLPHHVKAKKLVEFIQSLGNEKVIVFTEYRATQFYLEWYLLQHNITSVSYHGGMKGSRKTWITELFKNDRQVFIATEAGGEGINLQFCRYMINYDLPWNPMRLEQRIGRIHRYGQKHNMNIYHFAIRNTIEEHIMKLLYSKIDLFQRVIGKLDHILEQMNLDVEKEWKQIMEQSDSVGEMDIKLRHLTAVIDEMDVASDAR